MADHPMQKICRQWIQKIRDAEKVKHAKFGKYANECMKFFA